MRIVLVRHPTPAIAAGLCYGRLDVPIAPEAAPEVETIAGRAELAGARHVWTSPARRCFVLAEAVARRLAVPLTPDRRLLELDFGHWEGRNWDDLARESLDRWAASPLSFAPPGGESGADLIGRVRLFHDERRHDGRDCAVVSHGGPLKILAALLRGSPVDLLAAPPPFGATVSFEV
jgi:alpha-ribazole phosphatase